MVSQNRKQILEVLDESIDSFNFFYGGNGSDGEF